MLRYHENNELHRDFHGSTNTALKYVAEHHGVEALKAILRKTGREVYKSIHDKLAKGDASELIEHLNPIVVILGHSCVVISALSSNNICNIHKNPSQDMLISDSLL